MSSVLLSCALQVDLLLKATFPYSSASLSLPDFSLCKALLREVKTRANENQRQYGFLPWILEQ